MRHIIQFAIQRGIVHWLEIGFMAVFTILVWLLLWCLHKKG